MSTKSVERISGGLYSNLSRCLSGLIETRAFMDDAKDAFSKERKEKVDQLIESTSTAMEKAINDVNSYLKADHACGYYKQLTSLAAWVNTTLSTDKTTTSEKVVEVVKELLLNAYVKEVE